MMINQKAGKKSISKINTLLLLALALFIGNIYSQNNFFIRLADSALLLTQQDVLYDPSYISIPYPNGDVPSDRGVCTDVIIRAYRKFNIDLSGSQIL